ncbi:hypothetical protein GALMADRAFT_95341 [Galerina marginata CBS 339.88]|uniref:Uncharacterized protein n=1 Tax=Galerina marginata (strain CBS 339.88) TaxID=685588 RepID=A0A067T3A3_GALM3|nr:hypothetical protein GALMADRAFT_95341 [Galerina marginata CBS 339.88]
MGQSSISVVQVLLFSLFFGLARGYINQTLCLFGNCVQQDSKGRWCYAPDPHASQALNCSGGYARDTAMTAVMNVHLKQGLSIAYYSGVDNVRLGGVDFPFPSSGGIVHLCLSGKGGDESFQSLCEPIHKENDIYGLTGDPYCVLAVSQDFVSDGCYVPASGVVLTDDPSTSTLTSHIQSTSSAGSSSSHTITTTLVTLASASITTIVTNGATQTVIVAPQVSVNSDDFHYSEDVVLPIILSLFGVILVGLGVFVWWYKKRARERTSRPDILLTMKALW